MDKQSSCSVINSDHRNDNLLNNHLRAEEEVDKWQEVYLESIAIGSDGFENEYFVDKFCANVDWETNPVELGTDCMNAILAFRVFNEQIRKIFKRRISRYVTYYYFHWEDGINQADALEAVEDYSNKLFERGVKRS